MRCISFLDMLIYCTTRLVRLVASLTADEQMGYMQHKSGSSLKLADFFGFDLRQLALLDRFPTLQSTD